MSQQQLTTEQTHQRLRNLLLKGRILINGIPPTALEINAIVQGEQMLFTKAMQFDKAQAIAAEKAKKQKAPKAPPAQGPKKEDKKEQ